jgi:hypothetical protein
MREIHIVLHDVVSADKNEKLNAKIARFRVYAKP